MGRTFAWPSNAPRRAANVLSRWRSTRPAGASRSATTTRRMSRSSTPRASRRSPRRTRGDLTNGDLIERRLVERRRDAGGGRTGAGTVRRANGATFASPLHARRPAPGRRHSRRVQHDHGHPALRRRLRLRRGGPDFRPAGVGRQRDDAARAAHGGHARQARRRLRAVRATARRCASGWDMAKQSRSSSTCSPLRSAIAGARPAGLVAPLIDGLPVSDWEDNDAPKIQRRADRARELRKVALPGDPAGPTRLRAGNRMVGPRLRRRGQGAVEAAWARRRLGRQFQRRRRDSRGRLWRRHDPLAALERRAGAAGAVRRTADAQMGRLDADRLLHGLARRRGPDRLARQSRLGAAGRLLPRLALLARGSTAPTSCSWC